MDGVLSGGPAEVPDGVLLRRHAAGDREAFGVLVRRHQDRLWAVALRTLGNPDDAADAIQDGLISAMRAASGFRGEARVTTWLHRIVVNACLDQLRRGRIRPHTSLPDDDHLPPDARDHIAEREVGSEVEAALGKLPVEQRVALVLVDVEGYSVDDAAAIVGVPPGTIKSRCSRGRARLAPMLAHLRNQEPRAAVPQPNGNSALAVPPATEETPS